jgi:1-aminocyclopropane-1-carboxylate deaminase/D-cysteine desulfhydrase-like pyridoxal-dependent ACC family enzyme
MRSVPLFNYYPQKRLRWVPLIREVTPVYRLDEFERAIGAHRLLIKREDLTDSLYGGNKVRNLEFLLGDAKANRAQKIISLAPLGSNFIAALSAQASKLNLPVEVHHFIPTITDQMQKHAAFSKNVGANLRVYPGSYLSSLGQSSLYHSWEFFKPHVYRMPTGGSNALGALGHVNAFLELIDQIKKGDIPNPDVLIVGAGTCGTMAGLVAAQKITNYPIKIIGVRCVDRLVCNTIIIARIANQVLQNLGVLNTVDWHSIDLRDHGEIQYGTPTTDSTKLIKTMLQSENLLLDTTYTSKVVSFISQLVQHKEYQQKTILYWHTFSAAAMTSDLI